MAGDPIRVAVCGALGRMGREVSAGVAADPELTLVGGVDVRAEASHYTVPGAGQVALDRTVDGLLGRVAADVMVDFTHPEAVLANVRAAMARGVSVVVGTTGISSEGLAEIAELSRAHGVGAVVAPNFAVGANLMMYFAKVAARFLPAAEIIELHHDGKADAPSGTALSTARAMLEARGADLQDAKTTTFTLEGVRGGEIGGIRIHSVRLPGLVAHQEVIFGGQGQTLTIRHDSLSRESFLPGVRLAIKEVVRRRTFVYGLDTLMGLS
ncbi:MAG TPA: 4-hydroxy-tetrahydrodipicolinate reductase [Chloroflexota bacterium]